jgi:3-hexulose-6-phosphate synthase/6-phospho-3-hexuloisomerase
MDRPILQVALDFVNLSRALKVAQEAVLGGADWLEVGTPLIKSEGLDAVRSLREKFPQINLVADMKTMDAGRVEVETAAKAGANIVGILGLATDATIRECIEAAQNYGAKIEVDLIGIDNPSQRAREVESLGADYIGVHCAIDEQMEGKDPFKRLREVSEVVGIPVAVAGGINSETALEALRAGASIIIVGGAITKAEDAKVATKNIKEAIAKGKRIKTKLFKRVTLDEIRKVLAEVSTANLSDAMHRQGDIKNLLSVSSGVKIVGPALTVRTYPGDWAKTVEAVDKAKEGDVLVIDAGGVGPAVWGELATHGALQRKISGVIINGAVRDCAEIRRLNFAVWARLTTPTAGEPKGFGEIGVPVVIEGVRILTGDWIVGDDDGVVSIPQKRVVEVANRAMNVLELENRLRKEIDSGSTLAKVIELLRWEKKK